LPNAKFPNYQGTRYLNQRGITTGFSSASYGCRLMGGINA
jgi:hypothetical protein